MRSERRRFLQEPPGLGVACGTLPDAAMRRRIARHVAGL